MLKKSITYEDYDGEERTETYYFNLTHREIIETNFKYGDYEELIKELSKTQDGQKAYAIFKDIILASYGEKSADGRFFRKTPEIRSNLESSPALDELIIGFLVNPDSAAEFTRDLLPKKSIQEKFNKTIPAPVSPEEDDSDSDDEELSDEDLLKMDPRDMTKEQMMRAYALKSQ